MMIRPRVGDGNALDDDTHVDGGHLNIVDRHVLDIWAPSQKDLMHETLSSFLLNLFIDDLEMFYSM